MAEPTFKLFSMRHREVKYILEEIGRYVLRQKALAVGEKGFDLSKPEYQVEAAWPEMIAKDTTRYAAALQQVVAAAAIAVDKGYLTKATAVRIIASVAGRLGTEIDAEKELKAAIDERTKAEEDDLMPGEDLADDAPPEGQAKPARGQPDGVAEPAEAA